MSVSERNGDIVVADTTSLKRASISCRTEVRTAYGAWASALVVTAPNVSWRMRRLFHAALSHGGESGRSVRPMVDWAKNTDERPAGLNSASGRSERPRKKSSLK